MLKKILLTGSTGFIGKIVSKHLINNGYYIRGFDKEKPQENRLNDFIHGDLENLNLLRKSMRGMDCIIHLAAFPDDGDFENDLLKPNIVGVYKLFEAAKLETIKQVILASSVQTADIEKLTGKIDTDKRYPSNHYALLKIWAEDVGRMYSRLYGLSILSARLGWVLKDNFEIVKMRNNKNCRELYLSHNDLKRFFIKCLSSSLPPYVSLYALSCQENADQYDMVPSREIIGFVPNDVFPKGLDLSVKVGDVQCGLL